MGKDVEAVPDVDTAGCAALGGPKHCFHLEESALALGNRRDAETQVELEDTEEQEQEAVVAGESGLKGSLLDFSLGLHAVAGQHVSHVVEDHRPDAMFFS